jgi:hypothetical protein
MTQRSADPNFSLNDRVIMTGPTERTLRLDMFGEVELGLLGWQNVRTGTYQAPPPIVGATLELRTPSPQDQGLTGAQRVRAVGWKLVNGQLRPLAETVVPTGAVTTGSDGWIWVMAATARCGTNKAVVGNVDVAAGPGAGDGCVRIEDGSSESERGAILLPPGWYALVEDVIAWTDPPGGQVGARLIVEKFDDGGQPIDKPKTVALRRTVLQNSVEPFVWTWIRLQVFSAAGAVRHFGGATVTLSSPNNQNSYRSWLGPVEVP